MMGRPPELPGGAATFKVNCYAHLKDGGPPAETVTTRAELLATGLAPVMERYLPRAAERLSSPLTVAVVTVYAVFME